LGTAKRLKRAKSHKVSKSLNLTEREIEMICPGNVSLRLEMYGILLLALVLSLGLSFFSFHPGDLEQNFILNSHGITKNFLGPIGACVAEIFLSSIGFSSYAIVLIGALAGGLLICNRSFKIRLNQIFGFLGIILSCSSLCHLWIINGFESWGGSGGYLGELVGEVSKSLLSSAGAFIFTSVLLCISLIVTIQVSLIGTLRLSLNIFKRIISFAVYGIWQLLRKWKSEWRDYRRDLAVRREEKRQAKIEKKKQKKAEIINLEDYRNEDSEFEDDSIDVIPIYIDGEEDTLSIEAEKINEFVPLLEPEPVLEDDKQFSMVFETDGGEESLADADADEEEDEADSDTENDLPPIQIDYDLPTADLFSKACKHLSVDPELMQHRASMVMEKLLHFKISGKVTGIAPGPVVTMFEFEPADGVKVGTIILRSTDLAIALKVRSVRIVPVPERGVVGIEIPNEEMEVIQIRDILESDKFRNSVNCLDLAIGKDIIGRPVVANLANMPHLLIAGATGSGKSVGMNAMICSILTSSKPEEVRMLMIDPKVIELTPYEGIPHLMLPVVTDPLMATRALRWACEEMESRYQKLFELGVKNLDSFNDKVEKVLSGEIVWDRTKSKKTRKNKKNLQEQLSFDDDQPLEKLPYIVIIIDEFADLMMVASKDVESYVCRIAQKARAAGIHMILATQRPSVNVITGLIKANFPARISFRTASNMDSRTILDSQGAESLLGRGDMLMIAPGKSYAKRVHGCYVDESEVDDLVSFWKEQGTPVYNHSILEPKQEELDSENGQDGEYDKIYDQTVAFVTQKGKASASMLQRQFRIGYNRAARIIEVMERDGVVGPADGAKPRQVLANPI